MRKSKPSTKAKKEKAGQKAEKPATAIQPLTEDAMGVLLRAKNYQAYRKTSNNKTNEYAEAISALLDEQKAQEKEEAKKKMPSSFHVNKIQVTEESHSKKDTSMEADKSTSDEIKEEDTSEIKEDTADAKEETPRKIVSLSTWALKLVPTTDNSLDLIVLGVIKGSDDIVQSSFIKKRASIRQVMSKNTTYILENSCDSTVTPFLGFRDSTLNRFKNGFPSNWSALIRAEVRYLQKMNQTAEKVNKPEARTKRRRLE
ncbi:hypothetical protein NEPAR04_1273 [Nematocida parisii]|nr:hypothetical protein NEPAR08_1280 [Nematocida parisii]KAI5128593.1 hypothetical protein NEPAR03_1400 [Nematocida parisii]KAI5141890.1 hypothetical protein NEPAR04_1273 [Nematocida parisii]